MTTTFGLKSDDVAQALVLQPDGRILAVGYRASGGDDSEFALARYNADGTLDASFGTGGKVTTALGFADAGVLDPEGRIVAAGSMLVSRPDFDFAVARYAANGALDPSFGSGGKVMTSFGSTTDLAEAVALQADGKIVAAGTSGVSELRNNAFALVRYSPDGTLDQGFGSGGKVTTKFSSPGYDAASALAIQPDGKIVVAGSNFVASREGPSDFALARYNPDGTLDASFGAGGKVTTTFGTGGDFGNALVLQPDGKIVVVGYTYVGGVAGQSYFALARYRADGTLDPGFGFAGKVTTDFGPGGASAWAAALQPDGKIVAAGTGPGGAFALARYGTNGALDTSFGTGGTVTTAVGMEDEAQVGAVAVGSQGKVIAAGWSSTCTYQDFALTRYLPNGSLDTSFGYTDKRCIVPNLKGKRLETAKATIKQRNCQVGAIGKAFSRTVRKGYVIDQFPRAGTPCKPGQKVVLSVSRGKRR